MKYDLNKFLDYCKENELSFSLRYSEGSDLLEEIEIISPGKSECFYMKRAPTIDFFLEMYQEHMTKEKNKI